MYSQTGRWTESLSGIGSNADSFYEYLLKSAFLFGNQEHGEQFSVAYLAIKQFNQVGDWFADVDYQSGEIQQQFSEYLQGFWAGIESSLGKTRVSAHILNAMHAVSRRYGFMPEEFDYLGWQFPSRKVCKKCVKPKEHYLLRPEVIEGTYMHYRSTGDRSWLVPAKLFLDSLLNYTSTSCGFASLHSVHSKAKMDSMPSYFLAETCKYLFLIFDEDNFVHTRPFVFSTEAHLFDALWFETGDKRSIGADISLRGNSSGISKNRYSIIKDVASLLATCPHRMWYQLDSGYDRDYLTNLAPALGPFRENDFINATKLFPHSLRSAITEDLFCSPQTTLFTIPYSMRRCSIDSAGYNLLEYTSKLDSCRRRH